MLWRYTYMPKIQQSSSCSVLEERCAPILRYCCEEEHLIHLHRYDSRKCLLVRGDTFIKLGATERKQAKGIDSWRLLHRLFLLPLTTSFSVLLHLHFFLLTCIKLYWMFPKHSVPFVHYDKSQTIRICVYAMCIFFSSSYATLIFASESTIL